MPTESESLFEEYCTEKSVPIERIEEESQKRPDYFINVADMRIVAEIKQIDPNREDRAKLAEFEAKGIVSGGSTPGGRVRSKITSASRQIANIAKGQYAGILVLYDNLSFVLGSPLEPYNIKAGMYGFDTIVLSRPVDVQAKPTVLDRKFGPKRKLTEAHNTSISALAVLERQEDGPRLLFYHNQYASIPLSEDVARSLGEKQYRISEKEDLEFQEWVEV